MSENRGVRLVRGEASFQRATFLELFLDLVFVFALTRISARVIDDFTDGQRGVLAGLGQALLLFLALWAVWSLTVWSTSWLDPETSIVQTVIVLTMVGAMTMAVAVPDGFGARAASSPSRTSASRSAAWSTSTSPGTADRILGRPAGSWSGSV
ncbi:low temperature requirement protein A [Micromonospora sp. M12]